MWLPPCGNHVCKVSKKIFWGLHFTGSRIVDLLIDIAWALPHCSSFVCMNCVTQSVSVVSETCLLLLWRCWKTLSKTDAIFTSWLHNLLVPLYLFIILVSYMLCYLGSANLYSKISQPWIVRLCWNLVGFPVGPKGHTVVNIHLPCNPGWRLAPKFLIFKSL